MVSLVLNFESNHIFIDISTLGRSHIIQKFSRPCSVVITDDTQFVQCLLFAAMVTCMYTGLTGHCKQPIL